jgi:hypothetical protein
MAIILNHNDNACSSSHRALIRPARLAILLSMACFVLPGPTAFSKDGPEVSLRDRVQGLLNAYALDDSAAILKMLDVQGFSMYGSDASEIVSTPAQLTAMMANDFKLWHTAKFGAMRDIAINVHGDCGSMFFQIPFSAGGSPDILVRFTTVWRRVNGRWMLTMSSNSVPTTGSSAADILKVNSP